MKLSSVLALATAVTAQQFSIASDDDIKKTAAAVAWDLLQYYHGNETGQTPGILPGPPASGLGPYYWWEAGAMWGTLLDYWFLTGDDSYNDLIMQGIQFQSGPQKNFMDPNYTLSMGNDDQGFWGMTALTAAENNFTNPPADKPQWVALAQGVFNDMASPERWQTDTCGGGLRWQVPFSNVGYNYKNSIANGCFFNIAARLARYTHNDTYADWAEKVWDWVEGVGYMGKNNDALYDGAHVEDNCTKINKEEYSYNNAVYTLGAAYMYNYTNGSSKWEGRVSKLVDHGFSTFFPNDIAYEPQCETSKTCTTDMKSFKGYLHRWYATSTSVAPFLRDKVLPVLKTSAEASIKVCTGGDNGRQCGFSWAAGQFDGIMGVGPQMNTLGAVSSLLITETHGTVSKTTGGSSKGDPTAGGEDTTTTKITTADRAGAGILTFLVLGSSVSLFGWMCFGDA
ncbi:glycoside hydrolase family 76 protein [Emericellopsis atlantica]|uniref:Mannan endo-1,6-alpha-mannosidase n=1 Tax=Emericellopsis atlantica TaxID=2614577 RepID=A0A9P7ZP30_9HYPO|nr:glycoside hydrolase family 76 protein [Emericellopsis atlantica]KAG9255669.1 glycoside hydrolase family 76 protein [Emericellopsis atlantica]